MSNPIEDMKLREVALKKIILDGSTNVMECLIIKLKTSKEVKTKEDCIRVMEEIVKLIREDK